MRGLFRTGDDKIFLDDLTAAVLDLDADIIFHGRRRFDGNGFIGAVGLNGRPFVRGGFLVVNAVSILACTAGGFCGCGDGTAFFHSRGTQGRDVGQLLCHADGKVLLDDSSRAVLDLYTHIILHGRGRFDGNSVVGAVGLGG